MLVIKSPYPQPPPTPDLNIHHLLFNAPGQDDLKNYVLQIDGPTGREQTWYEFRELVYDGITALSCPVASGGLGLDPVRDVVGIYSYNCLSYSALGNALLAATIPFTPISAFSTPVELVHLLRTSGTTFMFVQADLLPLALSAARTVGILESSVYILEGRVEGRKSFIDIVDQVRQSGVSKSPVKPATRHTLAYLVFSSGTTGLPKAVMCSHGNLWAILLAFKTANEVDDSFLKTSTPDGVPVTLVSLPMHHAYGIFLCMVRPFSVPFTNVILPNWNADAVLRAIPRYRVNIMPVVPSFIVQLLKHPDINHVDLSSVNNVISGTAYTSPSLSEEFKKYVRNTDHVSSGYGLTEMTLSVARIYAPGCFGMTMPHGSVGVLYPGIEAKLVRPDGSDSNYGEDGELCLRGDTAALGYFRDEAATRETFVNGWVKTGDIFKVDQQGFLYFVDRAKDTLKIGGAQVSPMEIEQVLLSHPDRLVSEACVAGVSGGRTSDEKIPRAWVVLTTAGTQRDAAQTIKILDGWVKASLSKYKWLRGGLEVVDEIPKNATGKMLKRVLQERFETSTAVKGRL